MNDRNPQDWSRMLAILFSVVSILAAIHTFLRYTGNPLANWLGFMCYFERARGLSSFCFSGSVGDTQLILWGSLGVIGVIYLSWLLAKLLLKNISR
jgi:hypothetical protein